MKEICKYFLLCLFVGWHISLHAEDPSIPEGHVVSENGRVTILKMAAPSAAMCDDFSQKDNAECDVTIPVIPATRHEQYLQYILEAANSAQGVHPALIIASIGAETSFRGPLLENETEKDAWMKTDTAMTLNTSRDLPTCFKAYPVTGVASVQLLAGTHLRMIEKKYQTDHSQTPEVAYDRIVITQVPGHAHLKTFFPGDFHTEATEVFCTIQHTDLINHASPVFTPGAAHNRYLWGRGIGQFGDNNAAQYGLDWRAQRPMDDDAAWAVTYNQARTTADELWPIWSPRGSILAKSRYLREMWDRVFKDNVRGEANQHAPIAGAQADTYRVDYTYRFNEVHMFRYVIGMYNRGLMPINSLKEGYRQNLDLPREYIQTWHIPRIKKTTTALEKTQNKDTFPILNGEYTNRCHVAKVNRVCGLNNQGYIAEFENYFKYKGGLWQRKN